MKIPSVMKSAVIENYILNRKEAINNLKVIEVPVPSLSPGQVLIRMECAPCNQSDLLFLQGAYGVK